MNRPRKPSGSNPTLIIGALLAVAIVVGIIYQSQSSLDEDIELIAIPEQVVEPHPRGRRLAPLVGHGGGAKRGAEAVQPGPVNGGPE